MEYGIVVLNWNSCEDIVCLLDGLSVLERRTVVVVDNGSDEPGHEREMITHAFPDVEYLQLSENLGYAAGMNLGVAQVARRFPAAVLVNADARPTSRALASIACALDDAMIVGVRQSSSLDLGREYATAGLRNGLVFKQLGCNGCRDGKHAVDLVSGAVIAFRVGAWRSLGGMNPEYFHYKEEVDFALRASLSGMSTEWICEQTVFHRRGGSLEVDSPDATYYRARNELLYYRWNSLLGPMAFLHPRYATTAFRHWGRAIRHGNQHEFWLGTLDGARGLTGRRPTTPRVNSSAVD